MIRERVFDDYWVSCEIITMGKDCTVALYGGDIPHVGCAVLSIARPSLTGEGVGVSTSVINCLGHKDEVIARQFAEALAKERDATVVCICGIHIDHLMPNQLKAIQKGCDRLLARLLKEQNRSIGESVKQ